MKKTLSLFIALSLVIAMIPVFAVAEGEVTNIVWYHPDWFSTDEAKLAAVMDACNEMLADKGLSMEMKLVESGEYAQKMRLLCAGGEEADIMWMGYLGIRADESLKNGMIQPMEPFTAEVPALMDVLSIYHDGQNTDPELGLYAVPCLQIMASGMAMLVRKDIVEQNDLYDEIENIHDIVDLSNFLLDVKQNMLPEGMYVLTRVPINDYRYDDETDTYTYYPTIEQYFIDLDTMQVLDDEKRYAFELEFFEMSKAWQENGFYHPDMMTISDPFSDLWATNLSFTSTDTFKPGGDVDWFNRYGVECVYIPYEPNIMGTGWATCLTLPYQSTKGQDAMKLIEQVYTDAALFNTITNGIEGVDYEWADEDHIQQLEGCYQTSGWAVGNQFLEYPKVGQPADIWEQTKAINESGIRTPIIEFAFDKTPVEAELANISAVRSEYSSQLNYGLCDDVAAVLTARNEALKAAGEDTVIAEINAQLNAFMGR